MPEKKPSNPKDALGIKKVPMHTVPTKPLLELALAMTEGGRKYGSHNYRVIDVRMSTYYNAAMRHLMAWWEGEDIDPDSGVHHLVKAIASLFVVRDAMHMDKCTDDRPPNYPDGINMSYFNVLAAGIIEKYPECAEPFTQIRTIIDHLETESNEEAAADEKPSFTPDLSSSVGDGKWFCKGFACMKRGVANVNPVTYRCPDHIKKETT